jgi:CRP-like cAMP-binding protein
VLEQALQNPKTSTGLNEWMDARLDVKLKQVNDKMDGRFAQMDAKMDDRFAQTDAKMDGRFEQMNIKLDSKSDIVEMLKETTKAQGEIISKQNVQLQELLSVAAVNRMLTVQNAELKTKVEKYEQMLFKNTPVA